MSYAERLLSKTGQPKKGKLPGFTREGAIKGNDYSILAILLYLGDSMFCVGHLPFVNKEGSAIFFGYKVLVLQKRLCFSFHACNIGRPVTLVHHTESGPDTYSISSC